jgi:DNA replication protein DnaC
VTTPASKKSFSTFDAYEPSLVRALAAAQLFVRNVKQSAWSGGYCLSFVGVSGNGKTLLARMILAELGLDGWGTCTEVKDMIQFGHLHKFTAKLFDLRKVSDQMKGGQWDLTEAMEEPALAVLDDVGADYDPNKIFASKLDRVLRSRGRKWTVVTANMPLEEIASKLDTRIASWLIRDENKLVQIQAGDYALRTKD